MSIYLRTLVSSGQPAATCVGEKRVTKRSRYRLLRWLYRKLRITETVKQYKYKVNYQPIYRD